MSWINLSALWKILVFGLIAGAGLPALFAAGLYSLSLGPRTGRVAGADGGTDSDVPRRRQRRRHGASRRSAFLIILAAIGWGVYEIYTARPPGPEEVAVRLPREGRINRWRSPTSSARSSAGSGPGYPEGVPERDYIPLFALLGSQLTNDEVTSIADELAFSADPESAEAIKKAIAAVTHAHAERRRHRPGPRAPRGGRLAAGRPAAGLGAAGYHGSSRPSLVKVPVGPPLGSVIAQTTLAAPCAADLLLPRAPSVVTWPGHTALTRMPSR